MSVVVRCGVCQQRFAAAPHLYGTRVACPSCGGAIDVPLGPLETPLAGSAGAASARPFARPAAAARPPRTLRELEQQSRQARQRPPRTVILWSAIAGGLGLALIVGIVAGSWVLFRSDRSEALTSAGTDPLAALVNSTGEDRDANRPIARDPAETLLGEADAKGTRAPAETTAPPDQTASNSAMGVAPAWEPLGGTSGRPAETPSASPVPETPPVDSGPEDPGVSSRRVRECWEAYKQALERRDGKAAVACINRATVEWYDLMRQLAIAARRSDLEGRPVCDKMSVLKFRQDFSLAQLRDLSGEAVLADWVLRGKIKPLSHLVLAEQVLVQGDTAQALLQSTTRRGGAMISFYRENGHWKVNLLKLIELANEAIGAGAFLLRKSQDDLILEALAKESGTPLPANIWEPLDPNAKLDPALLAKTISSNDRASLRPHQDLKPTSVPDAELRNDLTVVSSIPTSFHPHLLFASTPHPFVAVDGAVWDLRSGTKVGQMPVELDSSHVYALSPSGTRFAYGPDERSEQPIPVRVCDCRTNQLLHEFEHPGLHLNYLHFADDDRLVSGWRESVVTWDLAEGRVDKRFAIAEEGNHPCEWALSPDGKYLAVGSTTELLVYDIRKGRMAARMETTRVDALPFGQMSGLAFSPDLEELAAFLYHQRLVVWSNRGKIVLEIELPGKVITLDHDHHGNLAWLPNKAGWFINGCLLVLREPPKIVWEVQYGRSALRQRHHLLGNDHVAITRGGVHDSQLVAVAIPWDQIRQALAAGGSGRLPIVTDFGRR